MVEDFPLAEHLLTLRARRRVRQEDVAEAVGVVQTTIGSWERGESRPLVTQIPKLCAFFGVTSDALLGIVPLDYNKTPRPKSKPKRKARKKAGQQSDTGT